MSSETSSTPVGRTSFLINRNFALFWSGLAVSAIGDVIFETTLILWIVTQIARNQPWTPLAVSGILIAASLPILIIGPIAGVFADRWKNKRLTLLRMDLLRAGLIFLLILLNGILSTPFFAHMKSIVFWQLSIIYGCVFLSSICTQFFNPTSSILFNDIVTESNRAKASGLIQMLTSLSTIIGPPIAALLYFSVGIHWGLIFNALSFTISFFAILSLSTAVIASHDEPETDAKLHGFLSEFGKGIQFFLHNSALLIILATGIITMIWNGSFNALNVFFVSQNLHMPTSFYVYIETASGIGLTVGALMAGFLAKRVGEARLFGGSVLLTGLLVIVYSRMTEFVPAIITAFVIGLAMAATMVPLLPLMLYLTPREFIGRVEAVTGPLISLSSLLAIAVSGWLASSVLNNFHTYIAGLAIGPIDSILTLAGVLAVCGGIFALIGLRKLPPPTQAEEPTNAAKNEQTTSMS